MNDEQSVPATTRPVVTTKDTVTAYTAADMHLVFDFIDADDLVALDKLMLSGRAFHLPKGAEVYVLDYGNQEHGMCRLRPKGAITEIWASVSAIAAL